MLVLASVQVEERQQQAHHEKRDQRVVLGSERQSAAHSRQYQPAPLVLVFEPDRDAEQGSRREKDQPEVDVNGHGQLHDQRQSQEQQSAERGPGWTQPAPHEEKYEQCGQQRKCEMQVFRCDVVTERDRRHVKDVQ